MKKTLLFLFVTLFFAACSNTDISQERKDSLDAAAAADSMLKDATGEDTTAADKVAVDTSSTDGL